LQTITKFLISSALILAATVGLAPTASAEPSPFETLNCGFAETAPAGSPALAHKVSVGIRDGFSSMSEVAVNE